MWCARCCCNRRQTWSSAASCPPSRRRCAPAQLAGRLNKLDLTAKRDLLDLFTKSAGDWLDHWFESAPIKALFGFDSIVGNFASPYTPGSAYVLLHHVFGEVNGKKGLWGHAIGGMGAITQAMAACCRERGVDIRTGVARARSADRERADARRGRGRERNADRVRGSDRSRRDDPRQGGDFQSQPKALVPAPGRSRAPA